MTSKRLNSTLITLLSVFVVMALAVMPAQAAITGTGDWVNPPHTVSGIDWIATGWWHAIGTGTLTVDGGSQVDMAGEWLNIGWGGLSTFTVTGTGSKILADSSNGFDVARNGDANLIVEDGGWVDATHNDRALMISLTGVGAVTVTGAGSKITTLNGTLVVGMYDSDPGTLTVEDSGLMQTKSITMGFDGAGEGYIHMGAGGVLAVFGDHTTDPFVSGGLFSKPGGSTGEIQYLNGSTWENMTGAAVSLYTLEYKTSEYIVNGQDLNGYTVLTMGVPAAPAPELSVASDLDFGPELLNDPATTKPLTLENVGTLELMLATSNSLTLSGSSAMVDYFSILPSAASYDSALLGAGSSSSMDVTIQFDPGIPGATLGVKTAILTINSDDPNSPSTVTLTGEVVTVVPSDPLGIDDKTWTLYK
ncbi:hypothetical protein ACFL34_00060 [Candidatus Sumerlaeota bacterium]